MSTLAPYLPRRLLLLGMLLVLAALACLTALGSDSLQFSAAEVWAGLHGEGVAAPVVRELWLPRVLAGFVTGALLALAGALMQVLLRNPLAEPYVLGISGGAAVAALLAILSGAGGAWISGSAFAGALLSMLAVFGLARGPGGWTSTRLLLTGVVVASGWGAMISFLLATSPESSLHGMLFWLMGDLSYASTRGWSIVILLLGLGVSLALARNLNLLARGELQAALLGVATGPLRLLIYFLASLLTAAAVTMAGSIGFIGLIVPHLLRLVMGSDHRLLLPACVLLGGSLLVFADTLARTVVAPQQLPVGVLSALIGVPVFLFLLNRRGTRL
jgi:iron complex transport system permease protein